MNKKWLLSISFISLSLGQAALAEANSTSDLAGYYIGRDGLSTLTSGTYKDLSNPNFGKLTFLLNHGNHYHGIGTYSYSGSPESPVINDTNANNRIPESFTLQPPLPLSLGSGPLYGDKLITQHTDLEYSNLTWQSTDALATYDPGSEANILFNSSRGRWNSVLGNTQIALQLISITPGLFIGSDQTLNLFENSDTISLGSGVSLDFKPILWTATDALIATYSAEFRLIDLDNQTNNSGRFFIDVKPVPLPAAAWFFLSGLLGLLGFNRKRDAINA
jgi:hypothetical protein